MSTYADRTSLVFDVSMLIWYAIDPTLKLLDGEFETLSDLGASAFNCNYFYGLVSMGPMVMFRISAWCLGWTSNNNYTSGVGILLIMNLVLHTYV